MGINIEANIMSWFPVSRFLPLTQIDEFGWPQSKLVMVATKSGNQQPARFERCSLDEEDRHIPGRWVSACRDRWELTDEVTDWRDFFEPPSGLMPADSISGYVIDSDQLGALRGISKALYGDGQPMTHDGRRDLANGLWRLLGEIADQSIKDI